MAAGVPFIVQISYKPDCQGYLAGVRRDFDSIRTLLLFTPILHINPDQQCVPKAPVVTVAETLQFDSPGFDTIGVSGQEGVSYKQLLTQNGYINPPVFHFHLLFVNNQGYVPLHSSTFQRLDNSVVIPITADTLGNWDSVFTDSNSKIRYKIGQNTFEATKGITESVVVILQ